MADGQDSIVAWAMAKAEFEEHGLQMDSVFLQTNNSQAAIVAAAMAQAELERKIQEQNAQKNAGKK